MKMKEKRRNFIDVIKTSSENKPNFIQVNDDEDCDKEVMTNEASNGEAQCSGYNNTYYTTRSGIVSRPRTIVDM